MLLFLTSCDASRPPLRLPRITMTSQASTLSQSATLTPIYIVAKPRHLVLQEEHSQELQRHANEARRIVEAKYFNKNEPGIPALERLFRVALYSIKRYSSPEDICFAKRWQDWWEADHPRLPYDTRKAEDRFYAYAVERQLGFIPETEEITRFEDDLSKEYVAFSSLKYNHEYTSHLLEAGLKNCSVIFLK